MRGGARPGDVLRCLPELAAPPAVNDFPQRQVCQLARAPRRVLLRSADRCWQRRCPLTAPAPRADCGVRPRPARPVPLGPRRPATQRARSCPALIGRPCHGPAHGGTRVTVRGRNLQKAASCRFTLRDGTPLESTPVTPRDADGTEAECSTPVRARPTPEDGLGGVQLVLADGDACAKTAPPSFASIGTRRRRCRPKWAAARASRWRCAASRATAAASKTSPAAWRARVGRRGDRPLARRRRLPRAAGDARPARQPRAPRLARSRRVVERQRRRPAALLARPLRRCGAGLRRRRARAAAVTLHVTAPPPQPSPRGAVLLPGLLQSPAQLDDLADWLRKLLPEPALHVLERGGRRAGVRRRRPRRRPRRRLAPRAAAHAARRALLAPRRRARPRRRLHPRRPRPGAPSSRAAVERCDGGPRVGQLLLLDGPQRGAELPIPAALQPDAIALLRAAGVAFNGSALDGHGTSVEQLLLAADAPPPLARLSVGAYLRPPPHPRPRRALGDERRRALAPRAQRRDRGHARGGRAAGRSRMCALDALLVVGSSAHRRSCRRAARSSSGTTTARRRRGSRPTRARSPPTRSRCRTRGSTAATGCACSRSTARAGSTSSTRPTGTAAATTAAAAAGPSGRRPSSPSSTPPSSGRSRRRARTEEVGLVDKGAAGALVPEDPLDEPFWPPSPPSLPPRGASFLLFRTFYFALEQPPQRPLGRPCTLWVTDRNDAMAAGASGTRRAVGDLWSGLPDFTAEAGELRMRGRAVQLKGASWFGMWTAPTACRTGCGFTTPTGTSTSSRAVASTRCACRLRWTTCSPMRQPTTTWSPARRAPRSGVPRRARARRRRCGARAVHQLLDLQRLQASRWPDDGLWYAPGVTLQTVKDAWDRVQQRVCNRWNGARPPTAATHAG